MPRYLIIGNSAGGLGAAEAIREIDQHGAITIVCDESYPAYSRPLLPEYLCQERSQEDIVYRTADFYSQHGIHAVLGCRVVRLHMQETCAELESGEKVNWERLLLATGGVPLIPGIPGLDKKGVFTFSTMDSARAVQRYLTSVSQAVVIGGGLIGMAVTEALAHLGVEVTVVEQADRVLSGILDERGSAVVEAAMKGKGITLLARRTVVSVLGCTDDQGVAGGVVLSDGQVLSCNLVVVAIGVRPRTELLQGTSIKVNQGITVDSHMATSYSGVYACGDAAEAYDHFYGTYRLIATWPNAFMGGRVAGLNMAGRQATYSSSTNVNSLKYFGLPIVSAGIINLPSSNGWEVISRSAGSVYKRLVLKEDRIVGFTFVGDIKQAGLVFGLMREGVKVSGFQEALLADGFGLMYLPQAIRKEKLLPFLLGK